MNKPEKIVLASGNKKKVVELEALLAPWHIDVIPQSQFDFEEAEENGLSFVENAIIKARHACQQTGLPAIADDSGLEVDALQGQPGIYSARYAGVNASDADNNAKLLTALEGVAEQQRTARFQCVLVYMRHAADPTPLICQGSWEGAILAEPRGEAGFGYDPLFWVPEANCASAELTPMQKAALSHRGKALRLLEQAFAGS